MGEHYLKKELLQRLHDGSKLFEWIDSGSLDGVWFWDLENSEHEWLSPKFKSVFGYSEEEIPNTSEWWQQNIFQEDLPAVLDNFEKHCADPTHPYDQIVRYYHKDGSTVWVRCRGKVIFNDQGKPIRMIGAHTDLTPLMRSKEKQEALFNDLASASKARQTIFDSMLDSIIVIDNKGLITEVNKATCDIFGYEPREMIGSNINMLMAEEDAKNHDFYLKCHFEHGTENIIGKGREVLAKTRSGNFFYAHLSIAQFSESGHVKFVGTLKNIDEIVRRRKELEKSAFRDHLTGLVSRKRMEQMVELSISQCLRKQQRFAVFFVDLNKFKPINDKYGHEVGDDVLKVTAKRMVHSVRESDICSRYGGDEFVIVSAPTSRPIDAQAIVTKLQNAISSPMFLSDLTLNISASIGIAFYPDDGLSKEAIFSYADSKMYEHKRSLQDVGNEQSNNEEDLVTLTYISHSIIEDEKLASTCENIKKTASRRNKSIRVSGILLYCRHRFIQRLEGPRRVVDTLIEKIKSDVRHRNFTLLAYHSIEQRSFQDWSYMNVVFDSTQLIDLEEYLVNLELSNSISESESHYIIEYVRGYETRV